MKVKVVTSHWTQNRSFQRRSSLSIYWLSTEDYKNKKWLQFLFIVKAAVVKQQISKFNPQIQRTEASDHIYSSQRPVINDVKAIILQDGGRPPS